MQRFFLLCLCLVLSLALPAFPSQVQLAQDKPPTQSPGTGLPLNFERQTGDLDAMVKRGSVRALVLYSRSGFFYVDGKPEGIYYQAMQYFEQFVNQKLHTRQHVQVTFIPVRPDQLEAALTEGVGDLIAYGLVVTPEREQQVAFSIPIQTDVKQIVVTRKDFGTLSSLDRAGREEGFRKPAHHVLRQSGESERIVAQAGQAGNPD